MKNIICILCIFLLLTGCNQTDSSNTEPKVEEEKTETTSSTDSQEKEEKTDVIDTTDQPDQEDTTEIAETPPAPAETETMPEPNIQSYYLDIPQYSQLTGYYCAPAALQSVMAYHGIYASQEELAADLNTHPITGTEYEDLARVATKRIFPNGGGIYSYCIPYSYSERNLFEQRTIQDMHTSDPVFVSINNRIMYGDGPDQVHQVVLTGITVENGVITQCNFFDPNPRRWDSNGGTKTCTADQLWEAMIQNPEPGYVY